MESYLIEELQHIHHYTIDNTQVENKRVVALQALRTQLFQNCIVQDYHKTLLSND